MNVGGRPKEGTNDVEGTAGDGQDKKKLARFIMRADGSHRTVLNSPVTDEVTVKDRHGGPPRSQLASFLGFIDGKPALCMLKVTRYSFHAHTMWLFTNMFFNNR